MRDGDVVGDVGERRRAFVRGNDEIWIVAFVAHDVARRHDASRSGSDVVGDVEQRRDEELVGRGALGLDGFARAAARQPFRHEAALGADRHDHRVLDVLCFDEPEDFGAEILRPVGPADAAAGDLAKPQMNALDARRIDENLVQRPRQRHGVELAARKLHRDEFLRLPVVIELIEVGADRALHRVDEAAQDAILVEAVDGLQRSLDRRGDGRLAGGAFVRRHSELWIEAVMKQADDLPPR